MATSKHVIELLSIWILDYERAALQTCWPDADQKLCLFHVPQAVWRWLWAEPHQIAKDDRRQ